METTGKLTVELGARLVGLSERQMRRLRIRLARGRLSSECLGAQVGCLDIVDDPPDAAPRSIT